MTDPVGPDRYARLEGTFIERRRVADAFAILGGAGALGNEVAKNLALLGFGRVLVVDNDVIEAHNATRSVFFCMGELERLSGMPKATHVAATMRSLNPDVRAVGYVGGISDLGPGIYAEADLAFSTFDNMSARFVMNDRCGQAGRAMVDGGLGNRNQQLASGNVTLFDPSRGACFACGLSSRQRRALQAELVGGVVEGCGARAQAVRDRGGVPSTPMTASMVGAAQVLLGVKWLMEAPGYSTQPGLTTQLSWETTPRMASFATRRRPDCPHHPAPGLPIHRLDGRSDRLTLHDVLEAGQRVLGARGVVQLPVEVVGSSRCSSCGATCDRWVVWQRREQRACPACGGTALAPEGEPPGAFAAGTEPTTDQTLADIGFAFGERYQVDSLEDEAFVVVEVAGDLDALLGAESFSGPRPNLSAAGGAQ